MTRLTPEQYEDLRNPNPCRCYCDWLPTILSEIEAQRAEIKANQAALNGVLQMWDDRDEATDDEWENEVLPLIRDVITNCISGNVTSTYRNQILDEAKALIQKEIDDHDALKTPKPHRDFCECFGV